MLAGISVAGRELPLLLPALPLVAISEALIVRPPRASHLRAIGVALVVASAVSVGVVTIVG